MSTTIIADLAKQQLEAERAVAEAEEELKRRKAILRDIAEVQLPEAMAEMDLAKFETSDGLRIQIKEDVHAGIAKERMAEAVLWLRKHGHEKILKHQFTIVPDDDGTAERIEQLLQKAGVDAAHKPTIHHMTLKSWVKAQLEGGTADERFMSLFGVHCRNIAEIKQRPTDEL